MPAGVGITVEALFTPDSGATTLVQPAFRYRACRPECVGNSDSVTGLPWIVE